MADTQNIWTLPSGLVIRRVSGTTFRSAQPKDLADWEFMRDNLGIDTVVKLNTESEGSDKGARAMGLTVHDLPIPPLGEGAGLISEAEGLFEKPDPAKVEQALEIMAAGNCLLHCTHGQDRTGHVASLYRVRYDGWTTLAAWKEALELGYHVEFLALDWAWFSENAAGAQL